jgi:TM2 domain-containing membrane protein YozV
MTTPANPPAGWYPDPHGGPGQTYWDGQQWRTDTTTQAAAGSSAQLPMDQALGLAGPYPGGATQYSPAAQQIAPYGAPGYGLDANGQPLSDKSKLIAGLLQIFLSPFAVGRFYLGYTNIALIQIAVTFCTCFLGAWWPIIDGILIIMGRVPDPQGRTLRE